MLSHFLSNEYTNSIKVDLLKSHFISAPFTAVDSTVWLRFSILYKTFNEEERYEFFSIKSPYLSKKIKNALCKLMNKDKNLYSYAVIQDSILQEFFQKSQNPKEGIAQYINRVFFHNSFDKPLETTMKFKFNNLDQMNECSGIYFNGEKVIIPKELDEPFLFNLYKLFKTKDLFKYFTQFQHNQNIKTNQKLASLQIIHSFYQENLIIRCLMEQQQSFLRESAYIAHTEQATEIEDGGNPLSIICENNQQLRGQFHRKPKWDENRYFRIRKCTRETNTFELIDFKEDYDFGYEWYKLKLNRLLLMGVIKNEKLSLEKMFVLGKKGLRQKEEI